MGDLLEAGRMINYTPCHVKFLPYSDPRFLIAFINVGVHKSHFRRHLTSLIEKRPLPLRFYTYQHRLNVLDEHGKEVAPSLGKHESEYEPVGFWEFEDYIRKKFNLPERPVRRRGRRGSRSLNFF